MIDKDKKCWWEIARFDISDVVPDMVKDVYIFSIYTGADTYNLGSFTIGHRDNLDKLDKYGVIYDALDRALDNIIKEIQDEINININSDIDPDRFSEWFGNICVEKGYKEKLLKSAVTMIRLHNYKYIRIGFLEDPLTYMKGWLKR